MILNLRNILQERINKTVWDIECKVTYHDTKAVMYMNEYTSKLLEEIVTRGFKTYITDIQKDELDKLKKNGLVGNYMGTSIIIKNELKDFEIEIKEKEN